MALTLQEYGLPLDICLMIEEINYKKNFKLVFEELVDRINNDSVYNSHEWYFIQILSFIREIDYKIPKFNDKITQYIFNENIICVNVLEKDPNYYHHLLYKDHMNIQLYQKTKYNIYYNPNIFYNEKIMEYSYNPN